MKPKYNSNYDFNNNTQNGFIYSNSTKDLSSTKGIKRSYSHIPKKKKLSINIEHHNLKKNKGFPFILTSNSFFNATNLYLNKNNYIFQKNKKKENKYFEKEQLFDRVLKLQSALNILNKKYTKQKIENYKQSKEIKNKNRFLNTININNFKNRKSYSKQNINNTFESNQINSVEEKFKIPENISENKLKNLCTNLLNELKQNLNHMNSKEEENIKLKKEYENIKIANLVLISNLKDKCKNLEEENFKKDSQILELKKTMKCSKYNEIIKENEVYEKEMKKMKNKLKDSLRQLNYYKTQEEEIKNLYEVIKKKDFKIKSLENELKTLSNNLDEIVQKYGEEIISKDKIIKKQEREIKFKINLNNNIKTVQKDKKNLSLKLLMNQNNKDIKEIYEKNPELYQIYIEMRKKGINSFKTYNDNVLKKLKEVESLPDNKIIYIESLINLLNIEDKESKNIIMDFANKEFIYNKNLFEIKSSQASIFKNLFNKNKELKNEYEIKQILLSDENLKNKIKTLFEEYDIKKQGFITFNEMKEVIKEMKLFNIKEEILLYTKSEIFNKMDYNKLILLINSSYDDENFKQNVEKVNEKLKMFINIINHENNSLEITLSYIKEILEINIDDKKSLSFEVINIDRFVKFLNINNIILDENNIETLKKLCVIDFNFENKKYNIYLDYKKIINKLNELIIENNDIQKEKEKENI